MNPIQDILIAFNRIREEVFSKSKITEHYNCDYFGTEYGIFFHSHEKEFLDFMSLIHIVKQNGNEIILNLYPTDKNEILINYGTIFKIIPIGIIDLEEESKKDDIELILTYGKELLFIKQNHDEIIQRINLAFELLGRIK